MIINFHLTQYFFLEHTDLVSNKSFHDDFGDPDKIQQFENLRGILLPSFPDFFLK